MKKLIQGELYEILENHRLWLKDSSKGKRADLSDTYLAHMDLENINLKDALLTGVDLKYTCLRNANLKGTNLENANLIGANLENANLTDAYLFSANLTDANLSDANLSNSHLRRINLSYADLENANLSYANLSNANLYQANLINANLTKIRMSVCNLRGAKTDKKYIQIFGIGSRKDTTTFCVEDNHVWCGCWNYYNGGSLEEFKKRVFETYGESFDTEEKQYFNEYQNAIKYFKTFKE